MAELKRRTLQLSSGKQIKLFGSSVAIGKSLEIGEGYAPNILSCISSHSEDKTPGVVSNPHQLNFEEMMELADFNIHLWMNLKANIRKHGVESSKIFNRDAGHKSLFIFAFQQIIAGIICWTVNFSVSNTSFFFSPVLLKSGNNYRVRTKGRNRRKWKSMDNLIRIY